MSSPLVEHTVTDKEEGARGSQHSTVSYMSMVTITTDDQPATREVW